MPNFDRMKDIKEMKLQNLCYFFYFHLLSLPQGLCRGDAVNVSPYFLLSLHKVTFFSAHILSRKI